MTRRLAWALNINPWNGPIAGIEGTQNVGLELFLPLPYFSSLWVGALPHYSMQSGHQLNILRSHYLERSPLAERLLKPRTKWATVIFGPQDVGPHYTTQDTPYLIFNADSL